MLSKHARYFAFNASDARKLISFCSSSRENTLEELSGLFTTISLLLHKISNFITAQNGYCCTLHLGMKEHC